MPAATSSPSSSFRFFGTKKCRQYDLVNDRKYGLKFRLNIGTDYVPMFDITDGGDGDFTREMLFIRISPRGLIISHKPSFNLGSVPKMKSSVAAVVRNESFRPVCHRSKSEHCRVIQWNHVECMEILPPRTMVLTLLDHGPDIRQICSHFNSESTPLIIVDDNGYPVPIKKFKFEFLLIEDLKSFVACGIHYGIIHRNNNNSNNDCDVKIKRPAFYRRFFRWICQVFHN